MTTPIKILFLEDNQDDINLMKHGLSMAGMDTYTSKSREEMAMRLGVDKYIRKDGSIKQIPML